ADHGTKGPLDKGSRNFGSPLSSKATAETRLNRLRNKVIQEIVKTEEIYVNQLKIIQNEFMEDSDIKLTFTKREYNAIFSNIPILLEVNERLLKELKTSEFCTSSRSRNDENDIDSLPSIQSVADAFLNYAPYLKLYSTYASGFQQSHEILLKILGQNPQLRSLVKTKEENLNNTLQSYLITPIQRIPRYKLLLQQLISYVSSADREDPTSKAIIDSIKRLDQVAQHMNEMIRQHENSCKLIEISTWIGKNYHGTLVEPGRYFIKSGSVLKVPSSTIQQSLTGNNQFYLILLSDQLLSCKIKSEIGSKGCLQPTLVLPLKKCIASLIDIYAEVACEGEILKFTLMEPDDLQDWVTTINESSRALKTRSATLKKESSNTKPLRKEQIKDIVKRKKRGIKRGRSEESPAPTPGKLRRFMNISERLDQLVDYFSPTKSGLTQRVADINVSSPVCHTPGRMETIPEHSGGWYGENEENEHDLQNLKLMSVSRYPQTTCNIL
ncbi:putative protein tag-52, partial [Orchesella cincta]